MKFFIYLSIIFISASFSNACNDEYLCSSFMKEAFDTYCSGFLKYACPLTCGKCASDNLQIKFNAIFKPDSNDNVAFDEGIALLRILNINSDNAFITDLKDLVFDSKTSFTEFYQLIDIDMNKDITVNEFFNGIIKLLEVFGINFKSELKSSVNVVADITKASVFPSGEIKIPKLPDVIDSFMNKIDAVPHGLITMIKLQNLNITKNLDYSRIIIPHQTAYNINGKQFILELLDGMDVNDDGFVTLREVLGFIFSNLNLFNVSLPLEVHHSVNNYMTIIDTSVDALLKKYGLNDPALLNDRVLPELNNQKFVDIRIKIKDAILTPKTFVSAEVMKYFKQISNSLPQRKLTLSSIKEGLFTTLDKNQDFGIEIEELTTFGLVTLNRIGASFKDIDELQRVFKLYDVNFDRKLDLKEFLEMFKKP